MNFKTYISSFLLVATTTVNFLYADTIAYVTSQYGGVLPIDITSDVVKSLISLGNPSNGVAVTPDQTTAYVVSHSGSNSRVDAISVATNTVFATITLPNTDSNMIAISPNGQTAYVTNFFPLSVTVIDIPGNIVIGTIPISTVPLNVAFNTSGTTAYVTSFTQVYPIDVATQVVGAPINGLPAGLGIVVSPTSTFAYISGGDQIAVINTATNTLVNIITVPGANFTRIAISLDGQTLFAPDANNNELALISTVTNLPGIPIPLGFSPMGVAVSLDGSQVVVADSNGPNVSVIDTSTLSVVSTFTTTILTSNVALANSPPPFPVGSISGSGSSEIFLTQKVRIRTITWSASPSPYVSQYLIYRNGVILANIPATGPGPYRFSDSSASPHQSATYSVIAADASGQTSTPMTVIITAQ